MAERRMFNKTLMSGNLFTALNKSTQLLYMYLNLQADDDGICGNTKVICRMCGCGKTHLQALIDSGWLLAFEGGEVVIAHWHIHNQIRKDRYKPSIYTHVKERLQKGKDGVYQIVEPGCPKNEIPATQEREDKDSKEKINIDKDRSEEDSKENAPAQPDVSSSGPPEAACDDINIDIDYDEVLEWYQAYCQKLIPCRELTPGLRKKIAELYRRGYTKMRLKCLLVSAGATLFLQGQNDRGWQASLDWLLEPDNLAKVENSRYVQWL